MNCIAAPPNYRPASGGVLAIGLAERLPHAADGWPSLRRIHRAHARHNAPRSSIGHAEATAFGLKTIVELFAPAPPASPFADSSSGGLPAQSPAHADLRDVLDERIQVAASDQSSAGGGDPRLPRRRLRSHRTSRHQAAIHAMAPRARRSGLSNLI